MSERYSIARRASGLLVAGPAVGFAKGELVEFDIPTPQEDDADLQPAIASETVAENPNWPSNIQASP